MSKFGKNITIEKEFDGRITSVEKLREDSISINDREELIKEVIEGIELVLSAKSRRVEIIIEAPTNGTYLVRLVKKREVR